MEDADDYLIYLQVYISPSLSRIYGENGTNGGNLYSAPQDILKTIHKAYYDLLDQVTNPNDCIKCSGDLLFAMPSRKYVLTKVDMPLMHHGMYKIFIPSKL